MTVKNGIEQLDKIKKALGGARVGLVTAPTGVNARLEHTIDILREQCNLVCLFSPEHGVRGDIAAGGDVPDAVDSRTGITAYSIYGGENRPTAEMLDKIDVMVMDIADVGCRYYTFISTMRNVMEECARNNKKFVVLDRVNPINGVSVEGNILDMRFFSFVGTAPIPQRHGMTVGELAALFNSEYGINCDLSVVGLQGWSRELFFDDCGLLWINPSPNIPSCDTAVLYPGTCLFEGTNLSEGRGTTRPFEMIGAPWLDADEAAEILNKLDLDGVIFRPAYFEPSFSKHYGLLCKGVQVHVSDRRAVKPVEVGIKMLFALKSLSGDSFAWVPPSREKAGYFIDLLAGTDALRDPALDGGKLLDDWKRDAESFKVLREKYLLY